MTMIVAMRAYVTAALEAYLPSSDGHAEAELLARLRATETGAGVLAADAPPAPPLLSEEQRRAKLPPAWASHGYRHPMRAVQLSFALQPALWASRPSFFGRTRLQSCYGLSEDAERADYFVSHASPDGGARKVAMLREFLCLQPLLGRSLVVLPMLGAFLLPLGLGLDETLLRGSPVPPYALSCVPLALLACLVLWVLAAQLGALPPRMTPWALTPVAVWLDACSLCQATPESIDAGIDGLGGFLAASDKMVALVSEAYFRRLWTVYELATFCKANAGQLRSKLLLLSLEWPSSLHPCKRGSLSDKEEAWLAGFSCVRAECYKPSDRARLLGAIREQWGSEGAFDAFVRTELLGVMRESKAVYKQQLLSVALRSLELVMGD